MFVNLRKLERLQKAVGLNTLKLQELKKDESVGKNNRQTPQKDIYNYYLTTPESKNGKDQGILSGPRANRERYPAGVRVRVFVFFFVFFF